MDKKEAKKQYMREYMRKYRQRDPEQARAKAEEAASKRRVHRGEDESYEEYRRRYMRDYMQAYRGVKIQELEEGWYEAKFKEQNGVCKICEKTSSHPSGLLFVDHDHETGKVRGLLCDKCNRALGMFGDSLEILDRARIYLIQNGK